jgi:hypothetical protein
MLSGPTVLLVKVAVPLLALKIPPPLAAAELPDTVLSVTESVLVL